MTVLSPKYNVHFLFGVWFGLFWDFLVGWEKGWVLAAAIVKKGMER